jgi:hypothetical protein
LWGNPRSTSDVQTCSGRVDEQTVGFSNKEFDLLIIRPAGRKIAFSPDLGQLVLKESVDIAFDNGMRYVMEHKILVHNPRHVSETETDRSFRSTGDENSQLHRHQIWGAR